MYVLHHETTRTFRFPLYCGGTAAKIKDEIRMLRRAWLRVAMRGEWAVYESMHYK